MRSSAISRILGPGPLLVAGTLFAILNCEQVEVTTVSAARVELQPQNASIAVTESARLTATVLSSEGRTLTGRAIEWSSLQENIATVDNAGMVHGMTPGVATIRAVSGDASGSTAVTVTAAPSIALSPSDIAFSAVQNGSAPGERTVVVTNGGTGTLSGLTATVRIGSGELTWLTAALATTSAPTALILSANQRNFTPGTYNATVDIASTKPGVTTRSVAVRLTVLAPFPAIGLGANTISFDAFQGGTDPAQQQVGVTNAGGGSLSDLATTIDYQSGQPTGWLTATLSGTSAPAQLVLRAATANTPAGNYTANVRVTSAVAQNSPQTIAVNFAVNAVQNRLALNPNVLSYLATRGSGDPPGQTVQVTSLNSAQIAGLTFTITYGSGQPANWASAALSTTTTPASLTVNAAIGSLPSGIYSATVTVASPEAANSPQTIDLNFQVVDPLNLLNPPTGLSATAVSSSEIGLTWTPPAGGVTRYRVERKTGASGTYAVIDSTTATTYQSVGLNASTLYFYRVSACNAQGCSAPSTEASATTAAGAPSVPGAPANLTATPASATQIDLSWSAAVGAVDSYVIERKTAGGTYATIATIAKDSLTYRNTGLTGSTQYFYQVRACNSVAGCSTPSVEASATTFPLPPSAPSGLSATPASATQVDLSWTAPASGPVVNYRIERQDPGGSFQEIALVPAGTTTYSSTGLSGGTQYNYRVRACNQGGCSGYSNAATALTSLSAPANLTATVVSSSQIDLSWSASTGAANYIIERQIGTGSFVQIATVTATLYSDLGLNTSTQYSYQVKACNTAGCSPFSAPVLSTPTPSTPSAPTNLQAFTVSSSQIDLTWTPPISGSVTNYRIERQSPGGVFTEIANNVTTPAYSNTTGLVAGTQYSYQVRACNSAGCSAYSPPASTQTVPDVPSKLTAIPANSFQIDLAWSGAAGTVSTYEIERRNGNAGNFALIGSVAGGVLSYSDGTLAPDSQYGYRVRTCAGTSCSAYSNIANAKTPKLAKPGTPGSLSANAVSPSRIDLAWTPGAGTVSWQIIERSLPRLAFVQIDSIGGSATTYANTGLSDSTTYTYRVSACNAAGCSGHSNTATATTPLAVPGIPQNLVATPAGPFTRQIDVSWAAASGSVARYEIEAHTFLQPYAPLTSVLPPAVTYRHTGLTQFSVWTYRVRACNSAGCSAFSNESTALAQ